REPPVLVDAGGPHRRLQRLAYDLIVDAPARVVRERVAAVRPPRVLMRLLVYRAESIDVRASGKGRVEPRTRRRREARIILVRAPVLHIDVLVRHVEVAAEHERHAVAIEGFDALVERGQEPELGFLPRRAGRARREVRADDGDIAEPRLEVTSFGVEFVG